MTTALDQVKLALAADPTLRRGLQPARPDLRQPRRRRARRGELPARAAAQRRATPTRCTTTAGSCASSSATPRPNALFDAGAGRAAVPRRRAHAARPGRLPGARRPAGRGRGDAGARLRARPGEPVHGDQPVRGAVPARRLRARALLHPPRQRAAGRRPTRRRCGWPRASRTSSATARAPPSSARSCATASPIARGGGLRAGRVR